MRAELLVEFAKRIEDELDSTKVVPIMTTLLQALENQIASPGSTTQEEVTTEKRKLFEALEGAESNSYSPAWKKMVDRCGISEFIGMGLLSRLRNAFVDIGVTPIEARDRVKEILSQEKSFLSQSKQLQTSMSWFEIEADALPAGEFEVIVEIPGRAIDEELKQLGKEAQEISNILLLFEELATGSREPVKFRAIASSDPTFFLHTPWAAAALIATSIERLAKFYSQLQSIIKTHKEMKGLSAPPELLDQIKALFESRLETEINKQALALVEARHSSIDEPRSHELLSETKRVLLEVTKRLDEGYGFDVRGSEPDAAPDGEVDTELAAQQRTAARVVAETRPKLQTFVASEEPILRITQT